MSAEAAPRTSISDMPDAVLQQVFSLLDLRELLRCEVVCRRWLFLARHPAVLQYIHVSESDAKRQFEDNPHFIVAHGKLIRKLNIMDHEYDYDTIKHLLRHSGNLHSLTLNMSGLNEELVGYIAQNKHLRKLHVWCNRETFNSEYPIVPFHEFPELISLSLYGNELMTEGNKKNLVSCRLTRLVIIKTYHIDPQYMENLLASQRPTLMWFEIAFADCFTERCVQELALCSRLQKVSLEKAPKYLSHLFGSVLSSLEVKINDCDWAPGHLSVRAEVKRQ